MGLALPGKIVIPNANYRILNFYKESPYECHLNYTLEKELMSVDFATGFIF
jgi:hypothetical protein